MTDNYLTLSYWKVSKNIFYSLLFILPMLFIYEVLCFLLFIENTIEVRNGADVLFRQLFSSFGNYTERVYALILLCLILIIMYFNKNVIKHGRLKLSFLLCMFIESLFWASIFIFIMSTTDNILLSVVNRNIITEQFYLAIGAGIWEEILFRVGAINLVMLFMSKVFSISGAFSTIIAIFVSAVLFSFFHYLGPFGENFMYKSFYIRLIAGILLGSLYIFRGLGITAYTHIIYDIVIITIPIIMV